MANPATLTITGKVSTDADGSQTVFNTETKAGMTQILDSGPSGFVTADDPKNSVEITFRDGAKETLATIPGTKILVSKSSLHTDVGSPKPLAATDPNKYTNPDNIKGIALSKQEADAIGAKPGDMIKITRGTTSTTALFYDSAGPREEVVNGTAKHLELTADAAVALGKPVNRATGATTGPDSDAPMTVTVEVVKPLITPAKAIPASAKAAVSSKT